MKVKNLKTPKKSYIPGLVGFAGFYIPAKENNGLEILIDDFIPTKSAAIKRVKELKAQGWDAEWGMTYDNIWIHAGRKHKKYKSKNPINLYQAFHRAQPIRLRKVKVDLPKKGDRLIKIGRLESLTYRPEYPSKLRGAEYEHKMGDTGTMMLKDKPILATREDGTGLFIIPDKSKYKFTKRGIVG